MRFEKSPKSDPLQISDRLVIIGEKLLGIKSLFSDKAACYYLDHNLVANPVDTKLTKAAGLLLLSTVS